jgi:two-component system, NtrC family, nitrogen regulation response regulator GlnG
MLRDGKKGVYARVIAQVERELVTRTLRYTRGHLGQACDFLGLDRKTLRHKLRELKISLDKIVTDRIEQTED